MAVVTNEILDDCSTVVLQVGWLDGIGNLQAGVAIEHLTVLMMMAKAPVEEGRMQCLTELYLLPRRDHCEQLRSTSLELR